MKPKLNNLFRIVAVVLLILLCALPVAIAPRDARAAFGDCIAYDTFTRGDGAIGNTETTGPSSEACPQYAWTGGAISGNKNVITPTLGESIWDAAASTFESGTYSWAAWPSNTIANVSNSLEITYVDNASGAHVDLKDAADLSSNLTVGRWYSLGFDAKVNTGSVRYALVSTSLMTTFKDVTSTNFTSLTMTNRANSTIWDYLNNTLMGTGEKAYWDNLSFKPITLSSIFSTINTGSVAGTYSVKGTISLGTQAGLALCLNDQANPTAGIIVYHDASQFYVDKFTAVGTWTNLIKANGSYGAGNIIKADVTTTSGHVYLTAYYNNVQIGTQQDITDAAIISNTYHGIFSTYSGNSLDEFYISNNIPNTATPTNTATNTATNTPTASDTPINTPTDTATNTPTASDTPTNTPTFTHTFTNTFTITHTPTDTDTPTETYTPTASNTPTDTNTPTNTKTPTNTATLHYDATTTYVAALAYYTGIAEQNYPTVILLSILCGVILLGLVIWGVFSYLRRRR